MKNTVKSKLFISIVLFVILIFVATPLYATTTNPEHKQTIENFIEQIKAIQSQISEIAPIILNNTNPQENIQLKLRIISINTTIESLNIIIQNYFVTVPGVNQRNRHVLLTFNVINLIKSNLYTLNALLNATTDEERLNLLKEYSNTQSAAFNTLEILEDSLEKFHV
jgi:Sec-independent protein secretion pathway component TatC